MRSTIPVAVLAAAFAGIVTHADTADAQLLDRMKKRAEQQVERRVERGAEKGVDRALDSAEGAVTCAVADRACAEKARSEGKRVVTPDGTPLPETPGAAAAAPAGPGAIGEGVWANYDFVPGERVLFADDFTRDVVGDFPRRLEFVEGNLEVVEWQGRRFLRATQPSTFIVKLPATLGERFTVEFDVHAPNAQGGVVVATGEWPGLTSRYQHQYLNVGHARGHGVWKQGNSVSNAEDDRTAKGIARARIMADGPYVKVYLDERRVANVPRADLPRGGTLTFIADAREASPVYLGDLRVAEGGRDLYEALAASGRVATQGIFFDTGADVLRPESTPTLKAIAAMLAEHGDLRLTIEGHTDNVGAAAANLALSERRAAAVKAALVASFGVAADRLQTAGLGDTKPAAPNGTPEGRQQNRRVELVRN